MTSVLGGTIQEIAFKLAEANHADRQRREELDNESTLFVLGSHDVGKTTIVNKFLDRDPTSGSSRPTLALAYSFARRSATGSSITVGAAGGGTGGSASRPVCHVWELGGGLLLTPANENTNDAFIHATTDTTPESAQTSNNLCDIPLRSAWNGLRQLRIVLTLDLSRPNRIWADLTLALARLNATFSKAAADDGNAYESLRSRRWRRANVVGDSDETIMDGASATNFDVPREYFPVPLLLIGGKYDVFKNFDPEIKKHVCRALRSVALLLGADALLFVSTLNAGQMMAVREWLNRFAFHRGSTNMGNQKRRRQPPIVDHNEALAIVAGSDSWQLIGHMPKQLIAEVGVMLSAHIPPRTTNTSAGNNREQQKETSGDRSRNSNGDDQRTVVMVDPATDSYFREPVVDELRAQMDAERRQRWLDRDVRDKFHSMPSMSELTSSDF